MKIPHGIFVGSMGVVILGYSYVTKSLDNYSIILALCAFMASPIFYLLGRKYEKKTVSESGSS